MSRRRVNEVSFNFDSLTDMVTNLAGGLILIVLLLTVLNRQRATQAGVDAMKRGQADAAAAPAARPLELLRLKNDAALLERRLPELDAGLKKAREEIARLQAEADRTQPREAAEPLGKPGTPSRVEFRPPLLKEVKKHTGLSCVLMNGKVYCCIWAEYLAAFKAAEGQFKSNPRDAGEIIKILPSGDFDLHARVLSVEGMTFTWESRAVLKATAVGETAAAALAPGSAFLRMIDALDSETQMVDFDVYPDGFGSLPDLRRSLLERGFAYSWTPTAAGKALTWGTTNRAVGL